MKARSALGLIGVLSALCPVVTSVALASSASAMMNHPRCRPPLVWNAADNACDDPWTPPPVPAPVNPYGVVDPLSRTASADLHVTGWAQDPDATGPIAVQVVLDGSQVATVNANVSRPDGHGGFDTTVPAGSGSHQVCVVGMNVGPGSNTSIGCQSIDSIASFKVNSISYDVSHATIDSSTVENVYTDTVVNNTAVTQSSEVDGSKTVTDTNGWSDSATLQVGVQVAFKCGVPFVADGKVQVSASASDTYMRNGSTSTAVTWAWKQVVIVPAHSQVAFSVTLAESQISVPYTLTGYWVSQSGLMTPGTMTGMYTGINSHNMAVTLQQSSPGAATEPPATISQSRGPVAPSAGPPGQS